MSCRQSNVRDEVEVAPGERGGGGDLEGGPVRHACIGGALAGGLDRAVVVVGAGDRRGGVGLRHQDGGRPVAAARRRPRARRRASSPRRRPAPGSRRTPGWRRSPAGRTSHSRSNTSRIVLVPAHARPGAERFGDAWFRPQGPEGEDEGTREVDRAVGVGEDERLLLVQGERAGVRVELHVTARGLRGEPFGDVAGVVSVRAASSSGVAGPWASAGRARAGGRSRRRRPHRRAEVGHDLPDERHQLVHVHGHRLASPVSPGDVSSRSGAGHVSGRCALVAPLLRHRAPGAHRRARRPSAGGSATRGGRAAEVSGARTARARSSPADRAPGPGHAEVGVRAQQPRRARAARRSRRAAGPPRAEPDVVEACTRRASARGARQRSRQAATASGPAAARPLARDRRGPRRPPRPERDAASSARRGGRPPPVAGRPAARDRAASEVQGLVEVALQPRDPAQMSDEPRAWPRVTPCAARLDRLGDARAGPRPSARRRSRRRSPRTPPTAVPAIVPIRRTSGSSSSITSASSTIVAEVGVAGS